MPVQSVTGKTVSRDQYYARHRSGKAAKRATKLTKKQKRRRALRSANNIPVARNQNRARAWTLYTLELEDGCYYVGITAYKDVTRRYAQHLSGIGGARWTKLHKPVSIVSTMPLGRVKQSYAAKIETDETIKLMRQYGVQKVRGGAFCFVSTSVVFRHLDKMGIRPQVHAAKQEDKVQDMIVDEMRDRGLL